MGRFVFPSINQSLLVLRQIENKSDLKIRSNSSEPKPQSLEQVLDEKSDGNLGGHLWSPANHLTENVS